MKSAQIEYDVFLSHATEDMAWSQKLAEALRGEGVRVWFDKWELKYGDHLEVRLNDSIGKSRKMVAVWSTSYFGDRKAWTLIESFSQQHPDPLASERRLIPVLIDDCDIPPTLRSLIYLDFREPCDFDLRLRQLVEALDLSADEFSIREEPQIRGEEIDQVRQGRKNYTEGKLFEEEVATLYSLLGFEVKRDIQLSGIQIDLLIQQKVGGFVTQAVVECKNKRITSDERDQILAQQNIVQRGLPRFRWIAVSSKGFAADTRTALEDAGVDCVSYPELLNELVPLGGYVNSLIAQYENWTHINWHDEDWFIRPNVTTDKTNQRLQALTYLGKWLGDAHSNHLVLLGDVGTGKSTLLRFLAYNLGKSFQGDPLRHPAPVLIPLSEVRKELSLEGIVINHFSRHGVPSISYPRFEHLLRLGKVVLLFDAFDEMADRVRWEVTRSNFREIGRAAEQRGKVILTCRTHYFKDRNEQAKLIEKGLHLSEVETELYRELKQQLGSDLIYLQTFEVEQIKAYLAKARPQTAEEDWRKIEAIYNLKELAQRPLLLEMIISSLPRIGGGYTVNASNLYTVYTNIWIEREDKKGRILDKRTKHELMLELAWRMWYEEREAIHYRQLAGFVEKLVDDKLIEFGDEKAEDIASEMQAASFLIRDEVGNFSFAHRSFLEYFLAYKLFINLTTSATPNINLPLNTRRFDRKVIYFLTLLDEFDQVCPILQKILKGQYSPRVSENALQILYWSGRIRSGVEEDIGNPEELKNLLAHRIPSSAQLAGADLQEITLEAIDLTGADLTGADLSRGNLNYAELHNARFRRARLNGAKLEKASALNVDFLGADLTDASFIGAKLDQSAFAGAIFRRAIFKDASLVKVSDLPVSKDLNTELLTPVVQRRHVAGVKSIAYSPNGELLASGGKDGLVIIHRVIDGRVLRTLVGHSAAVNSVQFSPDGKTVASGSWDNSVRLWDTTSGELLRSFKKHDAGVNSVDFSPDGTVIADGSGDKRVKLYLIKTDKVLRTISRWNTWVMSVQFSPDGAMLAVGNWDSHIRLCVAATGKLIRTLQGHAAAVMSVEFSPNGKVLASGGEDGIVRLWDVNRGSSLQKIKCSAEGVNSVGFSRDGTLLACGSNDKLIRILDVNSGRRLKALHGHTKQVYSVAFSPSDKELASSSEDSSIRFWNVESGKSLRTLEGFDNWLNSVQISPSAEFIGCGGRDGSIHLYSARKSQEPQILQGHTATVMSLQFSPDSETLASASWDGSIRLWDMKESTVLPTLRGHTDKVTEIQFSPDGKTVASGSWDSTIRLWDIDSARTLKAFQGHTSTVRSVCFSPDGTELASASFDHSIKLWETSTSKIKHTLEEHTAAVMSVRFSPDGTMLASGSKDATVMLWHAGNDITLKLRLGHPDEVTTVRFSPDGKMVASGSWDSIIRLWDTNSGELLQTLTGHLGPVYDITFASNRKYLIAVGPTGRLHYWDVKSGKEILYRYCFEPGTWIDLLPDGRFNASPEGVRYLCYTEKGSFTSYTAGELIKEFHDPVTVQRILENCST